MARGDIASKRFPYLQDYQYGREMAVPSDYTSLLNAYRSWVYICANKNSISLASFPLKLYIAKTSRSKLFTKTKSISPKTKKHLHSIASLDSYLSKAIEIEEVLEHPFLDIMKKVNPFTNSSELKEITNIHQELIGNAYWYIVDNAAGIPKEIWILPADKMRIVPSEEEFISGYVYNSWMKKIPFTIKEVVHFKFASPHSPYYGMSPLSAVTHAYNLNENMNTYENALFTNMGRPDGVLETDDFLNPEDFKALKKEWKATYGKVKNAGKTAVLDMGVKYKGISFPPRELSYLAGRKATKEEIANAFGQSLALYDKDANRANADNATYMHMRDTISPRHRKMEQKINEQIIIRYDERLFCAFENCIPEDKEFNHKVRTESVDKWTTRNEVRHETGRDDVEGGDVLYQEGTQIPLGTTLAKEIESVSQRIANKVKEKLLNV